MGSLTTCDPGDIHNTIQACKTANVRCSVISLAAEVRVYKKLAKDTDGVFSVILDDVHLRDLLQVCYFKPFCRFLRGHAATNLNICCTLLWGMSVKFRNKCLRHFQPF